MATLKSLDRFINQLDQLQSYGRQALDLEETVQKHEAKALARLLVHLKPVMEFLDGPIPTRESWVGPPDQEQDRERSYYSEPGIVLVDNFESRLGDTREDKSNYSGFKLIFTRSGKLIHLLRYGTWSEKENLSYWSSEAFPTTITAEFAHKHFKEALANILGALARAVKHAKEKREELVERLQLINKVNVVLRDYRVPDHAPDLMGEAPDDSADDGLEEAGE